MSEVPEGFEGKLFLKRSVGETPHTVTEEIALDSTGKAVFDYYVIQHPRVQEPNIRESASKEMVDSVWSMNRHRFARYLSAIENGTKRGVYEQPTLPQRV